LGVKVVFRALLIMASLAVAITALFIAVPSILLSPALAHWQAGGFPSLSAAVGNSCGVLWSSATGAADLRSERPARATDLYGIGSITKTFVAVVTLQLVDDGRLDLERPVTDYVPRLRDMHIANVGTATLAQLMNHTSGIPSWEDDPRWIRDARGAGIDPNRRWQPADSLAYIDGKPALSPPGTEYHYANTNYTLLGLAIEAVTGQPLASEIRRRILAPLELHDTYLEGFQSEPVDHLPRRYHFDTEMFRTMAGIAPSFTTARPGLLDVSTSSLAPEWAAGGMVMTARDLANFAVALRDGRLLAPKEMTFMMAWRPAEPGKQVGHGLFRYDRGNDRHTIGNVGAVLGFGAQMEWLEGGDAVFVSLSNVGSIDAGDVPLDRHAALPFVLASLAYMTGVNATRCLGHSSAALADKPSVR
jgi:D-alanyl-D-alanine carboxypeptidase